MEEACGTCCGMCWPDDMGGAIVGNVCDVAPGRIAVILGSRGGGIVVDGGPGCHIDGERMYEAQGTRPSIAMRKRCVPSGSSCAKLI